jgi:hypothetical protein
MSNRRVWRKMLYLSSTRKVLMNVVVKKQNIRQGAGLLTLTLLNSFLLYHHLGTSRRPSHQEDILLFINLFLCSGNWKKKSSWRCVTFMWPMPCASAVGGLSHCHLNLSNAFQSKSTREYKLLLTAILSYRISFKYCENFTFHPACNPFCNRVKNMWWKNTTQNRYDCLWLVNRSWRGCPDEAAHENAQRHRQLSGQSV